MAAIEIMKTGVHIASSGISVAYSKSDLELMAAAYSPKRQRAVMTLGHPVDDKPDLGTIDKLTVVGNKLYAHIDQMAEYAINWVREGRYKHVSASFFNPVSPSNPVPGAWYLKHVGMLGAAAPAVKGLTPMAFSEGHDHLSFSEFASGGDLSKFFSSGRAMFVLPAGFTADPAAMIRARRIMEFAEVSGLGIVEAAVLLEGRG